MHQSNSCSPIGSIVEQLIQTKTSLVLLTAAARIKSTGRALYSKNILTQVLFIICAVWWFLKNIV
ncbi:MAG: hypothetical protein CML21_13625 [Rheinheimera sp.]|nr:hypothetical protein [Rheinheimera sp.]